MRRLQTGQHCVDMYAHTRRTTLAALEGLQLRELLASWTLKH